MIIFPLFFINMNTHHPEGFQLCFEILNLGYLEGKHIRLHWLTPELCCIHLAAQ